MRLQSATQPALVPMCVEITSLPPQGCRDGGGRVGSTHRCESMHVREHVGVQASGG